MPVSRFVKVAKLYGQAKHKNSIPHLEQVALAFQKFLKQESDITEMMMDATGDDCVIAMREMITDPPSLVAWRRCLSSLCNLSSLQSRKTVEWLWSSGLVESALTSVFSRIDKQIEAMEVQSTLDIIGCLTGMLANLVIDPYARARVANMEANIAQSVVQCLSSIINQLDDSAAMEPAQDLFAVMGQIVLEPATRTQLESLEQQKKESKSNMSPLDLVCTGLEVEPLAESASACMWNLANNSTILRKMLIERNVLEKLIKTVKSGNLPPDTLSNVGNVIQILSTEQSAAEELSISELFEQMSNRSTRASAAGTLWNMVRASDRRDEALDAGAIALLVELMHEEQRARETIQGEVLYKIMGALSSLCMSDRGAEEFGKGAGIALLLEIVSDTLSDDPFADSTDSNRTIAIGLTLLNNIATLPENRLAVRRKHGAALVSKCLLRSMQYPDRMIDILSSATSACVNLSIDDGDGDEVFNMMRAEGIIDALVQLLKVNQQQQQQQQNGGEEPSAAQFDFSNIPRDKIEELQKKASSALWNLAIHEGNLAHMESIGAIVHLVRHMPEISKLIGQNTDCPKLTKRGYYTHPSQRKLAQMTTSELVRVENFCVGHKRHGFIIWPGETNICGLDLDSVVTIGKGYVEVNSQQAPILNKPAIVTLANITAKRGEPVESFVETLKKICSESGSHFISYDSESKEWCFQVEHFSRIGLPPIDHDDEADFTEIDLDSDSDSEFEIGQAHHWEEVEISQQDEGNATSESQAISDESIKGHIRGLIDTALMVSNHTRTHSSHDPRQSSQGKKRHLNTIGSALSMVRKLDGADVPSTSASSSLVDRGSDIAKLSKTHGNHLRQISRRLTTIGERLKSGSLISPRNNASRQPAGSKPVPEKKDAIDITMENCFELFLEFSKKEHSSENVLLYRDIMQYWRMVNNTKLHIDHKIKFVKQIGDTYLRNGSEMEVNISQPIRYQVLEDILCLHLATDLFNPLVQPLKANLADIHYRFALSPQYQTYLKTLEVKQNVLAKYGRLLSSVLFHR